MQDLDLRIDGVRLPGGETGWVGVRAGKISQIAIAGEAPQPATSVIDLGGLLLLPGLIDGHVHLDKTFLGDRWHSHAPAASLIEHIENERAILDQAAPVEQRASALVELAIRQGTTQLRTHVDIDPTSRLRTLQAVLAVREAYREQISIQIVAFPQSGILRAPGTAELLDEALRQGADLIGGLDPAGIDGDVDGHLGVVFDLAGRHGVGVDLHLHDGGATGLAEIEQIAERTIALGMQGNVTIDHAYALGEASPDELRRVAGRLAGAGVSIMTSVPGNHAFPPILALHAAGVNVFIASDNIRDCWSPLGDADMFDRAALAAYRSGFTTDEELEIAFDLCTDAAARALGVHDYGLSVGAPADLVAVDAEHIPEAVVKRPPRSYVFKRGRVVAQGGMLRGRLNEVAV